jgi:hypothetical protein
MEHSSRYWSGKTVACIQTFKIMSRKDVLRARLLLNEVCVERREHE